MSQGAGTTLFFGDYLVFVDVQSFAPELPAAPLDPPGAGGAVGSVAPAPAVPELPAMPVVQFTVCDAVRVTDWVPPVFTFELPLAFTTVLGAESAGLRAVTTPTELLAICTVAPSREMSRAVSPFT